MVFDDKTGLFEVTSNTARLITGQFVFWHGDWHWSDLEMTAKATGKGQYRLLGKSATTKLALEGAARKTAANEMIWDFRLKQGPNPKTKSWGGISFEIASNNPDHKDKPFIPEILPDKSGWKLQLAAGEKPLRIVFFTQTGRAVF